jgi:hypothetical protein
MNVHELLEALRDPACYQHAPKHVDIIQTHLSIVCLADDLVFKLKKAITLPFVDFAPAAARMLRWGFIALLVVGGAQVVQASARTTRTQSPHSPTPSPSRQPTSRQASNPGSCATSPAGSRKLSKANGT